MIPAVLRLLERAVALLPFGAVQRIGAALGLAVHLLLPIRRAEVRRALALRLGQDAGSARRVARAMYRHLGVSALEFLWMGRQPKETLARLVRRAGWDRYARARSRGRGVIVVTGHVGNWDLCACSQAALGETLHVVTKRLTARGLDSYWMGRRSAMGVVLHEARGSLPALVGALRSGQTVGLVIDQRAEEGTAVPFLGEVAMTSTLAATLALRTGAPLLPVFLVREDDGAHTLRIGEPIEVDRALPARRAIREATLAANRALERIVRAHPEQWLWLHRRWKRSAPDCARRAVTV